MNIGIAACVLAGAATLQCVGGSPPDVARVPIPETTLILVVTKDPVKHLHYCQLVDRDTPISEHVMISGYMNEDLTLDRVESQGDRVRILLSGGQHHSPVEVIVDSRQRLILSPTNGRSSTTPVQK